MRTIPISLAADVTTQVVIARISSAVAELNLRIKSKGTLVTYPGSIHWHIVKQSSKGTLELTYWPSKQLLWFKISAGRQAGWIDAVLPILSRSLESHEQSGVNK
jgi:hypothetical protein